ncbi:MAG TPA: hypothetical protein VG328_03945 [Stellaceae bacterium]|nr:hypothetical protein [Stellaceae bacterium]
MVGIDMDEIEHAVERRKRDLSVDLMQLDVADGGPTKNGHRDAVGSRDVELAIKPDILVDAA